MATLLVIMLVTLGLALRAGAVTAPATDEIGLIDAVARTSLLVLLCLFGLLALGLMYGNVLGAGAGS